MNELRIDPTPPRTKCHSEPARQRRGAERYPWAKHVDQARSVSFLTHRLLAPLLALLLIAAAIPAATAQDAVADVPTLQIQGEDGTPTGAFYVEMEPGERGRIDILLAAEADEPVEAVTYVADVVSPPNGGFALAPVDEPLTEPAAWLDLVGDPITLETGEIVTRTVEIAVPANAEPGQYVAGLALATTDPVPVPGADGVGQLVRATAAIAITVPGDFETGFDLGEPAFAGTGSRGAIQVPVANTGAVPVSPQGTLILEGVDGEEVANLPVRMGAVFAGGETMLEVALPEWPPAGDYRLSLDLTDGDTNATADLSDVALAIPEPPPGSRDPEPFEGSPVATGVTFERVAVEPEGTPLQSVAVAVEIANVGSPVLSATLILEASRNGLLVEEAVIADDVTLADGVTSFTAEYAPEGGYGSGLWSFRVRLESTGPGGGSAVLIQSGTVAKIDVP